MEEKIAENDALTAEHEARIAEHESRVDEHESRVAEQEARIDEKVERTAERDAGVAERDANRDERMAERDARIAERKALHDLNPEERRQQFMDRFANLSDERKQELQKRMDAMREHRAVMKERFADMTPEDRRAEIQKIHEKRQAEREIRQSMTAEERHAHIDELREKARELRETRVSPYDQMTLGSDTKDIVDLLRNYQQNVSSNRINSSVSWNHNKILFPPYPEIDQAAYDVADTVITALPVPEDILHYPELLYL